MSRNEFCCDCTVVHEDAVQEVMGGMPDSEQLMEVTDFLKIFSDMTRIKIMYALEIREMCVCDIANVLSMTKSAVSHQLATLRRSHMVRCRREGKSVYYSLADSHIKSILDTVVEHINE